MSATKSINGSGSVMDEVGSNIIHHVSNSDIAHPIIHLPSIFGINFSVTKHVLMLWIVSLLLSVMIIVPVRTYLIGGRLVAQGWMNAIEAIVQFIRDSIVKPNVGSKWVMTFTPLILTFFFFILFANGIGMVPIFDILGLINRLVLHVPADNSHNVINNIM